MAFIADVSGFAPGAMIPKKFTCEGANVSPQIRWAGAPADTKSFALIVDDPDAPVGVWNHWLLWDIPANVSELEEDCQPAKPACTGVNDFGNMSYGGPCPPKGHGAHRYFFRIYAVGVALLHLPAGANRAQLERALAPHILAEAEYMGQFERR